MSNLWERQQNKRSRAKKERTKLKNASGMRSTDTEKTWILETPPENAQLGILISVHKNSLDVTIANETIEARLGQDISTQGRLDFVVGDNVWVGKDKNQQAIVIGRNGRNSFVGRARGDGTRYSTTERHVLAANVDIGVITAALKQPELYPKFIDRYLMLLQDGGVQPIICITKCDLSSERPPILELYRNMGIPVIETSISLNQGIEELKKLLSNKTAVFVGQSGVGKSSLIKAIDPSLEIATQEVREKTGEGKHTTTRSNLYKWAENSFIIDTPGIRSLGVDNIPKDQIRFLFQDFFEVAANCKYHDCLHLAEPDCAIKKSIADQDGRIDKRRYESYVRVMEE